MERSMVRKMAQIGSSYLLGLFAASFLGFKYNLALSAALILSAVIIISAAGNVRLAVCIFSASAGMLIYGLYDCFVYSEIIKYDGCEVVVSGKITEYDEYGGDRASYIIKGVIDGKTSVKVTLIGGSGFGDIGDIVTVTGKAAIPKSSYKFDAESYYKAKGIYLQINGASPQSREPCKFSLKRIFEEYREHIISVMRSRLDSDCAGVMDAMLFGDKSGIDSFQKIMLYRAGIGHIMAVSGVHLSVACSLFWVFLSRIKMNKFLRFGLLLVPIVCFEMLAGWSASVIRAAVMLSIVYGAELFKRRADTFSSLGIAVILLTAFSPFAVRDASFLLSAAGVFGIGVVAPAVIKSIEKENRPGKLITGFISAFCVMAVIFPVTALFFDEVSAISPITNLLLMPLCVAALICGITVTLTGGAAVVAVPVLWVCNIICKAILAVSEFAGSLSFSYIPLGSDFVRAAVIAAVFLIFAAVIFIKNKSRAAFASVMILALSMAAVNIYRAVPDGKTNIAVLYEGNAVTAIVHDKNSACVIDLFKGGQASATVVKYLNRNGLRRIDGIFLNADANASLPVYQELYPLFETGSLYIPEGFRNITEEFSSKKPVYYTSGGSFELDGYEIVFTDGAVTVKSRGRDIFMYGTDFDGSFEKSCDGAVRYNGKKRANDADAEYLALMNGSAETSSESGTVFIGKNVKFTTDKDGNFSCAEITG